MAILSGLFPKALSGAGPKAKSTSTKGSSTMAKKAPTPKKMPPWKAKKGC